MAIPGYHDLMLPLLKLAGDGKEHGIADTLETLATEMGISDDEKKIMLRSGQTRLYNRIAWALLGLTWGKLLERVGRGRFKLTQRGSEVLKKNPPRIEDAFLSQFEEFRQFKQRRSAKSNASREQAIETEFGNGVDATPDERLDTAYTELRETLAGQLIEKIRQGTDKFFEHLVVELLMAMYDISDADRGRVLGKSGDGGIDGVIQLDRLGFDMVYVQAKKWQNSVGPDEIRAFVGSLGEQKAHNGVFITSGVFTSGACQAAEKANPKVVLIDGELLAELMMDHGVGVVKHKTYEIQKLDSDYFDGV